MARPKKSIAQLKEAGTYRPSVHGTGHPEAEGVPQPPEWLNEDSAETFQEITALCLAMNLGVGKQDSYLIALLANTLDQYLDHHYALEVEGLVIDQTTDRGQVQKRPNPRVAMQNAAAKLIHSMLNDLGLSAVSRSRFQVDEGAKLGKSALGEFLAAGAKMRSKGVA